MAVTGTIRSGFLGGGFMARLHSRAARAVGARTLAVASSSPGRSALAAAELGIDRAVDGVDELLGYNVDIVHICTPNGTHAELALRVIGAGKHVICEKPLATNLVDALALASAAKERDVVAAVPFVYRYHPMVREARERVAAGEIGQLLTFDCGYLQDWMLSPDDDNWRASSAGGGPSRAFADIGSHLCDLFEFVAGERITRLTARTRRVYSERGGRAVNNEDAAAIIMETQSGAIGTLLISQMVAGRKNALTMELHGTQASLRFDQERPEELWIGGRDGNRHLVRDPRAAHPDAARFSRVPAGHAQGYQDAFNGFVADVYAATLGAAPEGLPTFVDGVRAVQLTEAVLRAAQEERWVDTPVTDFHSVASRSSR